VVWHPNGELLVSASYDDSIKLWADNDDEWICVQTLSGGLRSFAFQCSPYPFLSFCFFFFTSVFCFCEAEGGKKVWPGADEGTFFLYTYVFFVFFC
jgi:WD40 repeat protein